MPPPHVLEQRPHRLQVPQPPLIGSSRVKSFLTHSPLLHHIFHPHVVPSAQGRCCVRHPVWFPRLVVHHSRLHTGMNGQTDAPSPNTSWHCLPTSNISPGNKNEFTDMRSNWYGSRPWTNSSLVGMLFVLAPLGSSSKQLASPDSRKSINFLALQADHVQGLELWSSRGAITLVYDENAPGMYDRHIRSSSCGILKRCPSSCAMVKAELKPLSSTIAQDFWESHMVPISARPNVSHLFFTRQRSWRVTSIAASWWNGWLSSCMLYEDCHLQKLSNVSWALQLTRGPSLSVSRTMSRPTLMLIELPMLQISSVKSNFIWCGRIQIKWH